MLRCRGPAVLNNIRKLHNLFQRKRQIEQYLCAGSSYVPKIDELLAHADRALVMVCVLNQPLKRNKLVPQDSESNDEKNDEQAEQQKRILNWGCEVEMDLEKQREQTRRMIELLRQQRQSDETDNGPAPQTAFGWLQASKYRKKPQNMQNDD